MTFFNDKQERRRSQRIQQSVPLYVRVPNSRSFGGHLNTVEVSNHGCVIHSLRPFQRGTELRLEILDSHRTTTAYVVHSDPIGTGMHLTTWTVALELDKPGDIWMAKHPPSSTEIQERQRDRENARSGSSKNANQGH
jgi:hypothetical protein